MGTRVMVCRRCDAAFEAYDGDVCPTHGLALVTPDVNDRFPQDRLLGRVLEGRFALIDVLGEGGFGAVYRAVQMPEGLPCAVKVMHAHYARRERMRKRFRQEGRTIAALRAPSTVRLLAFGEEEGLNFMVLEFVAGRSLREVLNADGPLAVDRAVGIIMQVLESLAEAHQAGIVHRDIKPENIMLVRTPLGSDVVKVLDFGIAKLLDPQQLEQDSGVVMTLEGQAFGSPTYMPFEQVQGRPVPASDLYALGIMLFEMLTGAAPFRGTQKQRVMAHARQPMPALPGPLPRTLDAVIQRATAKDPTARFQTAGEMAVALRSSTSPSVRLDAVAQPVAPDRTLEMPGAESTSSDFYAAGDLEPPTTSRRAWLIPALLAGLIAAVFLGVRWSAEPETAKAVTQPTSRAVTPTSSTPRTPTTTRPAHPASVAAPISAAVDAMVIDLPEIEPQRPASAPISAAASAPAVRRKGSTRTTKGRSGRSGARRPRGGGSKAGQSGKASARKTKASTVHTGKAGKARQDKAGAASKTPADTEDVWQ